MSEELDKLKQDLLLAEAEKSSINQLHAALTSSTTQKIHDLQTSIYMITRQKDELEAKFKGKCESYDALKAEYESHLAKEKLKEP